MSHDKKTLVILTPGFAKDEADSSCIPMQQSFILALKKLYTRLSIIILSLQYPYHQDVYSWNGIKVIPFSGKNKGGLSRLLLRKKIIRALDEIYWEQKIDGILSFWYGESAWIGRKFAFKYDIPHYCWLMGQDALPENKYPSGVKLKAAELIALSDFLQDEFEKNHGVRPQHVVMPGIDEEEFTSTMPGKKIDLLAAGSLIPLKRYEVFVELVFELSKIIPGIKAMLVGAGPEKENLEKLVREYGIESNFIFTGELQHKRLLEKMQESKIFIHPSSYEGFGMVCMEALYAGCRVFSFCKPMKNEIEHWEILSSKNELLDKVLAILKNKEAVSNRVTVFTSEQSAKKIAALFFGTV